LKAVRGMGHKSKLFLLALPPLKIESSNFETPDIDSLTPRSKDYAERQQRILDNPKGSDVEKQRAMMRLDGMAQVQVTHKNNENVQRRLTTLRGQVQMLSVAVQTRGNGNTTDTQPKMAFAKRS